MVLKQGPADALVNTRSEVLVEVKYALLNLLPLGTILNGSVVHLYEPREGKLQEKNKWVNNSQPDMFFVLHAGKINIFLEGTWSHMH